jgi:DNA processing protein
MARPLTPDEILAWARLSRTPRIGAVTFARLIAENGDAAAAFEALARRRPDLTGKAPSLEVLAQERDAMAGMGAVWVASLEPVYPRLLAALEAPPPLLAAQGQLGLAQRRGVALVGAREASAGGCQMAALLAEGLSAKGFVIVSGLARGIDAAAHEASLKGGTIAVTAGGLDKPYPPQNLALNDAIAAQGLILTDAALGLSPRAVDFPRRNSIIAGLVEAVIVVEAAARSGALMTAHAATELGREVMAVPGSPLDPRARGANALIKDGATLVESAEDVLAALGEVPRQTVSLPLSFDDAHSPQPANLLAAVAAALSPTPLHVNVIARALGAATASVAAALTELELSGQAVSEAGGYAALPPAS